MPRCPICHAELVDGGPDMLDQCDGPTRTARRWECPRCPEPVLVFLPDPPVYANPLEAAT